MTWNELFAAIGGFTALVAIAGFIGRLVAQGTADAALKRFDSSLKRAEEEHRHALGRIEEEQKSMLKRGEELQKSAVAFASAIDTDLRTRRISIYAELWEKTGLLPMWPWNTELKYEDLHQLTHDFRDWYFKRGGMYLSESTRDAYFEVQKCINAILKNDQVGQVSNDDYNAIQSRCSKLRTELTEDILSRRDAPSAGA
jgi:hypothetical protein